MRRGVARADRNIELSSNGHPVQCRTAKQTGSRRVRRRLGSSRVGNEHAPARLPPFDSDWTRGLQPGGLRTRDGESLAASLLSNQLDGGAVTVIGTKPAYADGGPTAAKQRLKRTEPWWQNMVWAVSKTPAAAATIAKKRV